ncbi:uncharacterized protein J7T54_008060 [Emericellopsis cladophorae]|uniref:Ricin B lectin domain-containing protein n=1 Tax=Emericellopsis cladophorae TaxID=2686198 RepID=A0A9P9Y7N6_9HYPO|nr:uncharacterized protein J7T54_008060 [Emericellopsis cladophorae]KAI6784966.1 hypothetical protein J7T54_008060 [Emericellopsis cladophorae]
MHLPTQLALLLLSYTACTSAGFFGARGGNRGGNDILNKEAMKEAHPRDDTATRAFSDTSIQSKSGQCLSVDPRSGDFRANFTPVQLKDCNTSSRRQQWDIITSGEHIDEPGFVLLVSTRTQACFTADPRRDPGSQIHLFSCGGRADGSGDVSSSQLFASDGPLDNMRFSPQNGPGFCLTANEDVVDITRCDAQDDSQRFVVNGGSV